MSVNRINSRKKKIPCCGCCTNPEEFNSDDAIFDYFGKEYTEFEYVVENLAIRPAPKKLLDLVPVHSSKIFSKYTDEDPISEDAIIDVKKEMVENGLQTSKQNFQSGDFQSSQTDDLENNKSTLKVHEDPTDFISFKSEESKNEALLKQIHLNEKSIRNIKDMNEIRKTIKSKEYRTTKQNLSELCNATEQALCIKPNNNFDIIEKPMPTEIKDAIESLRFKKPLPQYMTRTEKTILQQPEIYYSQVTHHIQEQEQEQGLSDIDESPNDTDYSTEESNFYANSFVQTDREQHHISKPCACPSSPSEKKSIKWKIIINKHSRKKEGNK